MMEVTLSQHAGFCGGVKRAYDMILKAVSNPKVKKPIFVLGDLVHNKDVVESISKLGVKKMEIPEKIEDIFNNFRSKKGTLAITAHGMGPKIYELARREGVDIIDTTCPKVKKVHDLAKEYSKNSCRLILIGDRGHKEVEGICEWSGGKATVVSNINDLEKINPVSSQKVVIISQTTQNKEDVNEIFKLAKEKYKEVEVFDTVCLATQNRQKETRELAKKNDAVIIIGSPTSANSKRLWEICRSLNPRSHFVERKGDIKEEWFKNCRKVGVTAGASSPNWIIDEAVAYLKSL